MITEIQITEDALDIKKLTKVGIDSNLIKILKQAKCSA